MEIFSLFFSFSTTSRGTDKLTFIFIYRSQTLMKSGPEH